MIPEQSIDLWSLLDDKPHEECGVFGYFAPGEDVARITFFGLYALQHRGQESAGIATTDGHTIHRRAHLGLVSQAFTENDLAFLPGFAAIGHTRYSTTGQSSERNAGPMLTESSSGPIAVGHNGNIVNAFALRDELEARGEKFNTTTDSEVLARLIAVAPGDDMVMKLRQAMPRLNGAYSLVILTTEKLYAVRDPKGVRPLCIGQLGGKWIVASESCALMTVGATFVREVEPGEIIEIGGDGLVSHLPLEQSKHATCLFELIYFARPDSTLLNQRLHLMRQRMGAVLSEEHPVEADVVVGLPDSATPAAIGYAKQSGIPYGEGLIKNRYIGRTFIQPDQRLRDIGVSLKFNALPEVLEGKRVVLIDDTIVRGTTSRPIVNLLRNAGASEVHMRVHAPPMMWPCYLGVDLSPSGRADSSANDRRGNWQTYRRRFDWLSFSRWIAQGDRRAGGRLLHWLLDRQLSDTSAAGNGYGKAGARTRSRARLTLQRRNEEKR